MRPDTELARILPALAAARIDYALCGGLALAVHGHPRATEDIGLLIREEQLEPALQVLERAGYGERSGRMTFQGKGGEKVTMERVARIEGTDFLIPDLILVSSSLEQVWESRREVIFAELPLRVVSREGLVRMKLLSDRPQDRADIAALGGEGAPWA